MVWDVLLSILLSLLPPHLLLTILLSYLVWSNFFKKGELLRPAKFNDLIELGAIFLMLFILVNSITYVSSIWEYRDDVQYWYGSVQFINDYIRILIMLFLILVIVRDIKLRSDHLKKIAFGASIEFTFLLFLAIGFGFAVRQVDLGDVFLFKIYKLGYYSILVPLTYIFFSSIEFLASRFKNMYTKENLLIFLHNNARPIITLSSTLFVSMLIGFVLGHFMIPIAIFNESQPMSYELRGYNGSADEFVLRSYRIEKYGHLFNLISLDYSGLSFLEKDIFYLNKSGAILPVGEQYREYYKDDGIEDFRIQNQTNSIIIKIDKNKLKASNISNFIMKGKREINISKDFVIEAPIECPGRNCTVDIKFANKLEQPIHANDVWLLNPATYSYGRCQVSNASGTIKKDDIPGRFEFRRSDVDYRFQALPPDFFMLIRSNMLNGLYVDGFTIEGKTEVDLQLTLICG